MIYFKPSSVHKDGRILLSGIQEARQVCRIYLHHKGTEEEHHSMATQTAPNTARTASTQSASFERFAGMSAIVAGIAALLYSIAFVILHNTLLSPLFLMLSAL